VKRSARQVYVTATLIVAVVFFVGSGVWAFGWPQSFYDVVASYPPFNAHLFRDIGAFLLGLGAAPLGALAWRDARFVALLGGTVAAALHWLSHVIDRHDGGTPADPWLTGAFALLMLGGLVVRATALRRAAPTGDSTTEEGVNR
jgi:hypothetical protein